MMASPSTRGAGKNTGANPAGATATTTPTTNSSNSRAPTATAVSPLLQRNVYISGLPTGFTSNNFRQLCQQFGKVEASKLCVDANSNPTKGYGFCLFFDTASAESCIRGLHGAVFGGRKLQVRYADAAATPQPSTTAPIPNPQSLHRGGGGGGGAKRNHHANRQNPNTSHNVPANEPASTSLVALPAGGFFLSPGVVPVNGARGDVQQPPSGFPAGVPFCLSPPPPPPSRTTATGPLSPLEHVNPLSSFTFYPTLPPPELLLASSMASQLSTSQQPQAQQQQAGSSFAGVSVNGYALGKGGNTNYNLLSPLSSYSILSASLAGSSASSTNPNPNPTMTVPAPQPNASAAPFTPPYASLELAPGYNPSKPAITTATPTLSSSANPNALASSLGIGGSASGRTNPISLSPPLSDIEADTPTNDDLAALNRGTSFTHAYPDTLGAPPVPMTFAYTTTTGATGTGAMSSPFFASPQQVYYVPMAAGGGVAQGGGGATGAYAQPFFFAPPTFNAFYPQA